MSDYEVTLVNDNSTLGLLEGAITFAPEKLTRCLQCEAATTLGQAPYRGPLTHDHYQARVLRPVQGSDRK